MHIWSWDFHVGDSGQHRLRRGAGSLVEPFTERFAEDGAHARIRDGESNGNDEVACLLSDPFSDLLCPAPALEGDPHGQPHSSNPDL